MKTLVGVLVASLAAVGTANAALIDRGSGLIYDDVLNVTWLKDANYAKTSGYDADGWMDWDAAIAWTNQLTYGGYADWRLPRLIDTGSLGCSLAYVGTDCGYNVQTVDTGTVPMTVFSEMAYMYYVNLDNKGYATTGGEYLGGHGLIDDPNNQFDESLFINLQSAVYWTGISYALANDHAWTFYMDYGYQDAVGKPSIFVYAWPVRDGDVMPIPEPETWTLMLVGLSALASFMRKRKV